MARKPSVRCVLNRKALGAITEGFVASAEAIGQAFVSTVKPPDATPFGEGLVNTPDYGVWAFGRKVAGGAQKPRAVKQNRRGVLLVAGEGFPGHLQEFGTIHHGAQPHVTPAYMAIMPAAAQRYIKPAVRAKLARVR